VIASTALRLEAIQAYPFILKGSERALSRFLLVEGMGIKRRFMPIMNLSDSQHAAFLADTGGFVIYDSDGNPIYARW